MKNIFIYYLMSFIPFGLLIWLIKTKPMDSWTIIGLILFYSFVYRPYIDGKRLVEKNIIQKKDIWKMIFPWKTREFFNELYLK